MAEGEELASLFRSHRAVTQQVAAAIPADQGEFRPWSGAMSVRELIRHMAASHSRFVRLVAGRQPRGEEETQAPDLPAALRLLEACSAEDAAALAALGPERLAAEVVLRDRPVPGRSLIQLAREHEIHHKGQLILIARMVGAPLPQPFRWRAS